MRPRGINPWNRSPRRLAAPKPVLLAAAALWVWSVGASLAQATSVPAPPLEIHVVELPPLAMRGDPPTGILVDVAVSLAREAGYDPRIEFLPRRRTQQTVSEGENLIGVGIGRTGGREGAYVWLAPILSTARVFVTLDHPINSYAQARGEGRIIGVDLGYVAAELLERNGIDRARIRELPVEAPRDVLLAEGRIDAWFQVLDTVLWQTRARPAGEAPLLIGEPVERTDHYVVCSLRCDPALRARVIEALDRLRARGDIDRIIAAYRGPSAPGGARPRPAKTP